jgi:hypothetical protein
MKKSKHNTVRKPYLISISPAPGKDSRVSNWRAISPSSDFKRLINFMA